MRHKVLLTCAATWNAPFRRMTSLVSTVNNLLISTVTHQQVRNQWEEQWRRCQQVPTPKSIISHHLLLNRAANRTGRQHHLQARRESSTHTRVDTQPQITTHSYDTFPASLRCSWLKYLSCSIDVWEAVWLHFLFVLARCGSCWRCWIWHQQCCGRCLTCWNTHRVKKSSCCHDYSTNIVLLGPQSCDHAVVLTTCTTKRAGIEYGLLQIHFCLNFTLPALLLLSFPLRRYVI